MYSTMIGVDTSQFDICASLMQHLSLVNLANRTGMKRRLVMLTLVAAFLAQAGAVIAQGVFSGDWVISRADDAPWLVVRPVLKPAKEAFLHKAHLSFKAGQLFAPSWIGFKQPNY